MLEFGESSDVGFEMRLGLRDRARPPDDTALRVSATMQRTDALRRGVQGPQSLVLTIQSTFCLAETGGDPLHSPPLRGRLCADRTE